MAMPTNTFATYEAIGNREDLSDVIYLSLIHISEPTRRS